MNLVQQFPDHGVTVCIVLWYEGPRQYLLRVVLLREYASTAAFQREVQLWSMKCRVDWVLITINTRLVISLQQSSSKFSFKDLYWNTSLPVQLTVLKTSKNQWLKQHDWNGYRTVTISTHASHVQRRWYSFSSSPHTHCHIGITIEATCFLTFLRKSLAP